MIWQGIQWQDNYTISNDKIIEDIKEDHEYHNIPYHNIMKVN